MTRKRTLDSAEYLTPDELVAFLKWMEREERRRRRCDGARINRMMAETLALSGLRSSELCGLRICDVPPSRRDDTLYVRCGKGAKDRIVNIPPDLVGRLADWVDVERDGALSESPLFVTRAAQPFTYPLIWKHVKVWFRDWNAYRQKRFERLFAKTLATIDQRPEPKDLSTHSLRHSYAIRFIGVNGHSDKALVALMDQLGHTDPKTTMIYVRSLDTDRKSFADAMAL